VHRGAFPHSALPAAGRRGGGARRCVVAAWSAPCAADLDEVRAGALVHLHGTALGIRPPRGSSPNGYKGCYMLQWVVAVLLVAVLVYILGHMVMERRDRRPREPMR
jgi:hypothetical protein